MKRLILLPTLLLALACSDTVTDPDTELAPFFSVLEEGLRTTPLSGVAPVEMYSAELLTLAESGQMGRTVFFNDRGNKQTGTHFVQGDTRRAWNPGPAIHFAVDGSDGETSSGLTAAETTDAIRSAMDTWQGVRCSNLPLVDLGVAPFDVGYAQFLLGFGGLAAIVTDVTHGGFLPRGFFDLLIEDGGDFILGVTFTFVWVDDAGNPTDADGNGQFDAAFREIYYNDAFGWNVGANIDVETVALHEAGHGLSQAHFGTAFRTESNGKIHFAPRAVMNAAYSGVQTDITRTDNAGHCSNWSQWGGDSRK